MQVELLPIQAVLDQRQIECVVTLLQYHVQHICKPGNVDPVIKLSLLNQYTCQTHTSQCRCLSATNCLSMLINWPLQGWTPLFCAISARQDGHTAGGHSKLVSVSDMSAVFVS